MQQDNIDNFMKKARMDQHDAKILLDHGGSVEGTGFKCQQAVEKFLKAVLVKNSVNVPKRHMIVELKQLLTNAGVQVPPEFADLDLLDPYAVDERYGDSGVSGQVDMKEAYRLVEEVRVWAEKEVSYLLSIRDGF